MPLAEEIQDYVAHQTSAAIRRYLPDLRIPGYFAGHRIAADFALDLGFVLAQLHHAGVTHIADQPLPAAMSRILRQIDGEATEAFACYRAAEMLLAFGPFENNPLLAGFDDAARANIANAVDSTHIHRQWDKPLGGRPNNYWGVLARCEDARRRLGLPYHAPILDESIAQCRDLLAANPAGFFDDSPNGAGRFDIYSPDVHLFLEPLWSHFDPALLRRNLQAHADLLETLALENAAVIAWGRSIGALSICMTMELGAMSLKLGLARDPARVHALVTHAFAQFKTWMADDLIAAHRHRMPMNYRGPHRLLQMTFDCLSKLLFTAELLRAVPPLPAASPPPELFPPRDTWIPFSNTTAGVWMFRNRTLAFQLATVDHTGSDYVPTPRGPGLFENPVDSPMLCGVPRIAAAGHEFTAAGIPATVEKIPNGLRLTYSNFISVSGKAPLLPGGRVVTYQVEGDELQVRETWHFAQAPQALSLAIPETAARPLHLVWTCPQPHTATIVNVEGMQFWRSFWGELPRVHQIDITPATRIELSYTITPAVKVAHGPCDHDYNRALYDVMPGVQEIGFHSGLCSSTMDVEKILGDADIVHLGWPEHWFAAHGLSEDQFEQRFADFLARTKTAGKKIVWTLHNRRPHAWERARGIAFYRRLAPLTDACLHHSHWGEKLIRIELPFRDDCLHAVIPHGHYRRQMSIPESRADLERRFNLPPCCLRIGVLGRYQPEKQVELLLRAFLAADRPDIQLVLTAYRDNVPLPQGPGIIRLPRTDWMTRADIAQHTKLCDVLLAAHTGDTYLTSGLVADAVATTTPMLVPHWDFFHEIVGNAVLYHDNTEPGITAAIAALTPTTVAAARTHMRPLLQSYDPATLAPQVWQIFRTLRQRP